MKPVIPVEVPYSAAEWRGKFLVDVIRDPRFMDFVSSWAIEAQRHRRLSKWMRCLMGGRKELPGDASALDWVSKEFRRLDERLVETVPARCVPTARVELRAAYTLLLSRLSVRLASGSGREEAEEMTINAELEAALGACDALSQLFGFEPWSPRHVSGGCPQPSHD